MSLEQEQVLLFPCIDRVGLAGLTAVGDGVPTTCKAHSIRLEDAMAFILRTCFLGEILYNFIGCGVKVHADWNLLVWLVSLRGSVGLPLLRFDLSRRVSVVIGQESIKCCVDQHVTIFKESFKVVLCGPLLQKRLTEAHRARV